MRTLHLLLLTVTIAVMGASIDASSSSNIRRRRLPALDDPYSSSIGGNSGGASRPSIQVSQPPSAAPTTTTTTATNVEEGGPPRRAIPPFTISLWPVTSAPNYQQQIAVRDTVETFLELAMMVKYSPQPNSTTPTTATAVSRSAVVNYIGLTEIFNTSHTAATSTVEITLQGMAYFAQGSTNVPTSEDLVVWIVSEALPTQGLYQALVEYFPTLEEFETYLPEDNLAEASPTTTPTVAETVAATLAPTIATESPTVATESPTVATAAPTGAPTAAPTVEATDAPTEDPTEAPTTLQPTLPPVPAVVLPAPTVPVQQPSALFEPAPPVQQPSALFQPAPPVQQPSALFQPPPSPLTTASATAESSQNNVDDSDTINVNVLIGCSVAGFVALILAAAVLVKINKHRYHHHHKGRSLDDDKMGLAVLNFGMKKSDDDDNDSNSSESAASLDRLVEMDIAKIVNLDDEEVLSGYIQKGDSRESASWASASQRNKNPKRQSNDKANGSNAIDEKTGDTQGDATPTSSSSTRVSSNSQSSKRRHKEAGAFTAYWASFFGKSKKDDKAQNFVDEQQESSSVPDATRELGSASAGSTDGGAGTDGTLSDFEDLTSVDPDIAATKTIESFEKRARHDIVVKKDMLESSAAALGFTGVTAANHNGTKSNAQEADTSSNPPDLELTKSEVEEEKLKNEVMIPNPYFRRPFNGTQPPVDRSSSCALQPTDTSAATLAQRDGDDSDDDEKNEVSQRASFSRMVPRISSPKSWWRNTTPSKQSGSVKSNGSRAALPAQESEDEDTMFGPSPSDGWDPADCDVGSKGASLPTEELFKLKVDNKTGQCLFDDNSRQIKETSQRRSSAKTDNRDLSKKSSLKKNDSLGSSAGVEYTDYHLDGAGSVSSEESTSLKLDSSYAF
jgi:hypothetical protein